MPRIIDLPLFVGTLDLTASLPIETTTGGTSRVTLLQLGQGSGTIGPTGPQGLIGPIGPQGPQGVIGNTGNLGPQGPQGSIGNTGSIGPQGPQGTIGNTGSIGPQGPQGVIGNTGSVGAQGPQGSIGNTGPIGPQGPQGTIGNTGSIGPQGPQGVIGNPGSAGTAGAQGPQGVIGNTGSVGPQGPQGVIGNAGSIGPQGPQGTIGNTGSTGLTGPQGPQGTIGNTGSVGPQGPQGVIGNTGSIGATGPAGPTNVAGTATLGAVFAKAGSIVNIDPSGTIDVLNAATANLGFNVTTKSGVTTTVTSTPQATASSVLDITMFGPIGNPAGDDATFAKALAYAQNTAATWGANAKGQCSLIRLPPGSNLYLHQTTISGSVVLESGGKSTAKIIPVTPATMQYLFVFAMDGSGGNNYPAAGAPKGSITLRGVTLWNGGGGGTGLYGADLITDPSGVKQMVSPYITNVPNDLSVGNTGNFTISGPNGESGPVCTSFLPAGRYRLDFTSATTYTITLLYTQAGQRVQYTANGTVGSPCTVSDINSNLLCSLQVNAGSNASIAGDIAYFVNGCSAIYCTNGAVALKPFIEFTDFQIYSFGGCGINADPAWQGQIRGNLGCVIKGCGADGVLGVTLYDGTFQGWEIASNGRGVTFFKTATQKLRNCNIFSNIWNNLYYVGGGSTGPMLFDFCELDHCQRGHAVYLANSGGVVAHFHQCNFNLTGQAEPNQWCDIYIATPVAPAGVQVDGCGFQSSYINSIANNGVANTTTTVSSTASTSITVASLTNIVNGSYVAGTGVPAGTQVTAINTSTLVLTLSLPVTVASGAALVFVNASQTALCTIGFTQITNVLQVIVSVPNSFVDSVPLWGQCLGGTGVGNTPVFITSPIANTTATAPSTASPTLLVAANTGISVGSTVVGAGITAGTTVVSVVGLTVTLSANASVTNGQAVAFQPIGIYNIPGGVNWGMAPPRRCVGTAVINGYPILVMSLAKGGTDAKAGVAVVASKDLTSGPTVLAANPFDPNASMALNLSGGNGGGVILSPNGDATSFGGATNYPAGFSGAIIANGTLPSTAMGLGIASGLATLDGNAQVLKTQLLPMPYGTQVLAISVAASNFTPTLAQLLQYPVIVVSGTLTATVQLVFPAGSFWVGQIINNTVAGAFNLQAKVTGGGSALTIPATKAITLLAEGANTLACYNV